MRAAMKLIFGDDALLRDSAAAYAREVCDPVAADRRALAREVRNAR